MYNVARVVPVPTARKNTTVNFDIPSYNATLYSLVKRARINLIALKEVLKLSD